MYNIKDNIVALATTPGKSALNIVRCSGPGIIRLYKLLANTDQAPMPNFVHLKTLCYKNKPIDQVMITFFRGPKSFTGQDMVEFSVHGGPIIIKNLVSIIEGCSFRQALPGEFSYRAFVAGKIDLLQAEAINSLVNSNNQLDALYSLNNIKGGLSKTIKEATIGLEKLITYIEHELDFDEGEINFVKLKEHIGQALKIEKKINQVLDSSFLANENKSNLNIVIVGKTNVGKSSLFNKIAGFDRSIVTNTRGTTRDTVEIEATIDGFPVTLIDTAGIRKTKELVEKRGISRTYSAIKKASIILFVDDLSPKKTAMKYQKIINQKNIIFIQNKVDINKRDKDNKTVFVSAKKNTGISSLFTSLSTLIRDKNKDFMSSNLYLINSRQKSLLTSSSQKLKEARGAARSTKDLVVFVSKLRLCYTEISGLAGDYDKEKIINNVFGDFCVGK